MNLYVFGAGHGAIELLEDSQFFLGKKQMRFSPILVEDNPSGESVSTASVLNCEFDFKYGIVSAWSPVWKEKIDKEFEIHWVSAISPRSNILLKEIPVGFNARSGAFCGSTAKIGRHVRLNFNSCVAFGADVGDYCFLSIGASMCGNSRLGKGSLLYAHAVILPEVSVGANTIIGAGSVVTRDIPNNVIAWGNPCKVVRENK